MCVHPTHRPAGTLSFSSPFSVFRPFVFFSLCLSPHTPSDFGP